MSGTFTKSMARNIFYGGSVFFFLLFLVLTFDTTQALPGAGQPGSYYAGGGQWQADLGRE